MRCSCAWTSRNEDQWPEVVRTTVARHGRLDVLVNNAGISGAVPDRMSTEYFDRLMAVNTRGTFLGMKYAIPRDAEGRAAARS